MSKAERKFRKVERKLREIALDLKQSNHLGELGYNAHRVEIEADELDNLIETYVSGSGTGED
jgi:hypothetical protein